MSIKSFPQVKSSPPPLKSTTTDCYPNLENVLPASSARAVRKELQEVPTSGKGWYGKLSSERNAKIAKYAAENGIAAAISHFKDEDGMDLKESTV